ncbi:hypothetical protein IHE44_0001233 [Lamprotornis superbus]|uniref:Mdm2-binding protein n=1 Tax=Lamprotornis superbus TaxID=245042 RepID=A0A835NUQ5_9PASS|nr:hypothetical protein IHE44_0001233 [Lamprotornis superbus]
MPSGTAAHMYQFLKESYNASINADVSIFPACSVAGIPGAKKWYFASHVICGYYQFCSSDWEEVNVDTQKSEDSHQASIDENLGTTQNFEEDDSNSRESLSLTEYNSDLTSNSDDPRGSKKFNNSWQKIADYLSADFVSSDDITNIIDLNELWRGKIQIWERKFGSGVDFPEFCIKSTSAKTFKTANLSSCFAAKKEWQSRNTDSIPEVFHYYGPALEFLQMEPVKKEYQGGIYTASGPDFFSLWEGNGSGGCKATLIHSAGQINGMATLAAVNGKLKAKGEEIESDRKELTKQPAVISTNEFKSLLKLTRECFLDLCSTSLPKPVLQKVCNKTSSCTVTCEPDLIEPNPLEWPERHVLQNLENFEKNKQKMRVPLFAHSSEQLLGHKDSQRESLTLLDAKELLKYFTPEGLPVGDLQLLQVPKRENAFLLTPELTPRKLRGLPFEKAAGCHYHGLEYCLDDRRALERDVGYAELQTRLIRYETQTTCTKECCPVPLVLSPLPSPAVLSEPGSVPDEESLQSELKTETSRLKRRSKDLDYFYPKKRLTKSESTDSLVSQASGSSRSHCAIAVMRKRSERSVSVAAVPSKLPGQAHRAASKAGSAAEPEASKQDKESRSQKHTRMLKEVVAKTLQKHGITEDHKCFASCSQRLFEISKFYLKDLKTSRGLLDEMKKTANSNAKQIP